MPVIDLGAHDLRAKQKASRLRCTTCGTRGVHSFDPETRNDIIICPICPDGGTLAARQTMSEREQGYAREGQVIAMTNVAVEQVADDTRTVAKLLEHPVLRKAIEETLPGTITMERFMRVAMTAMRRVPKLQECSPTSLFGSLLQAAALDIEPDTPLEHCHLVPFYNSKLKTYEAQLIVTYKGYMELGYRSGRVLSFDVDVVREGDDFVWTQGSNATCELVRHSEPDLKPMVINGAQAMIATGTNVTHAFAVAHLKGGGHVQAVLTKKEIDQHRSRSRAQGSGPWVTDYEPMAMKTAVRVLRKFIPVSIINVWAQADEVDEKPSYLPSLPTSWAVVTGDETMTGDGEHVDPDTGTITGVSDVECPMHGVVEWQVNAHGGVWHSTAKGEANCNPGVVVRAEGEKVGWGQDAVNEYLKVKYDLTSSKLSPEQMMETIAYIRGETTTSEATEAEQPAAEAAPAAEDDPQATSEGETDPDEAPVQAEMPD